jgi:hypothetical protein
MTGDAFRRERRDTPEAEFLERNRMHSMRKDRMNEPNEAYSVTIRECQDAPYSQC